MLREVPGARFLVAGRGETGDGAAGGVQVAGIGERVGDGVLEPLGGPAGLLAAPLAIVAGIVVSFTVFTLFAAWLLDLATRIEGYLYCLVAADVTDEDASAASSAWDLVKADLGGIAPRFGNNSEQAKSPELSVGIALGARPF